VSTETAAGSESGTGSAGDALDGVQNLLYRRPELYDLAYADDDAVARICARLFARHRSAPPTSLLDVGCGTGRELAHFADQGLDGVGLDYQPRMIEHARAKYPALDLRVADMRTVRLDRRFDAIVSFGLVLAYMQGNDDLAQAVATFAAHAAPGALLVIEFLGTMGDLERGNLPRRFSVVTSEGRAHAAATFRYDRRHQLLIRDRTWHLADGRGESDHVRWRLIGPLELEHHLASHGFVTVGMYDADDPDLVGVGDRDGDCVADRETDAALRGPRLLAVARYEGGR
jgi:SAM-dependent methyltransferase